MGRGTDINFAVAQTGRPLLAWLMLLAGGLVGAMALERHQRLAEESEAVERKVVRLERKLKSAGARPVVAPTAAAPVGVAAVGAVPAAMFPWNAMFGALENAFDPRIALLGLDTDPAARRTRLEAEARDIDAALGFAARLRAIPLVERVLLLAHESRQTATGAALGFSLQIDWKVDG